MKGRVTLRLIVVQQATADAAPRRSESGGVRLSGRDVTGLLLCAEHYAAPYDLLAYALGVQPPRLRGIVARWLQGGGMRRPGRWGLVHVDLPRQGVIALAR